MFLWQGNHFAEGIAMRKRELGSRLRRRRKELGLSVVQLANRACCTTKSVFNWEQGSHAPHVGKAIAIAKVLKISVEELFG